MRRRNCIVKEVSLHHLALLVGFVGAGLGVTMVVPQLLRIVRHPQLPGISAGAWSLTGMACLTWLIYGVRTGSVPQVPGNLLLVSGAAAIVLLVPGRLSRRHRGLSLIGVGAALATLALLLPARADGYLAFGIALVSTWPQVFESVATWRARRTSGVSISTWALRIASQVCWFGYAVGTGDRPVLIATVVAMSTGLALISLEVGARTGPAVPRLGGRPA